MSLVHDWAIRLAEEVAPDEAELAPTIAEAFMAGGKDRQELFAAGRSTVGGFASGAVIVILPYLFQALSMLGPLLMTALSSDLSAKFLEFITNAIKMIHTLNEPKSAATPPPIPVDPMYAPLRQIVTAMGLELRTAGLSNEQADLVTFRVLRLLLEQPQQATQLVQQVIGTGSRR
jgi:hypothetical protein